MKMSAVSAGTLQGVFRPQVRVYYSNSKYGLLYETLTKRIKCRSRARAIQLAKEWMRSEEFSPVLDEAIQRITSNPENRIE